VKIFLYRTIDSFREYLLIDQYNIRVDHYVKTAPNQWLLSESIEPKTLSLTNFDMQIEILSLYENVDVE
jgi:Uma2 family endonuclease